MSCVASYFYLEKTGNASLHFETNKHMQCIFAVAFLKHAIEIIVKYTNIIETHTVGWNKRFFSANLMLRFLLCDKDNAILLAITNVDTVP